MADSAKVVGDELVVTRDQGTVRLSLAVPLEGFDIWLEMSDGSPWRELHKDVRDRVMPASAREQIVAIEATDAVFAVALVQGWVIGLNERLGKSLSLSPFGAGSGLLSPPTSGSDTGSEPIVPEPTVAPRRSRSTRKPS